MSLRNLLVCAIFLVASGAINANEHERHLDIDHLTSDTLSMSMGTTSEGSDPVPTAIGECVAESFQWPWQEDPDHCHTKVKECNGRTSYKVLTNEELGFMSIYWSAFNFAAPANCVLAPIGSAEELAELQYQARAQADGGKVWVGLVKSRTLVVDDQDGSRDDWFNLDGTPARAVCDPSVWAGGQPNNSANDVGEPYVILDADNDYKLRDLKDGGTGSGLSRAIYKCCDEVITFPSCDAEH